MKASEVWFEWLKDSSWGKALKERDPIFYVLKEDDAYFRVYVKDEIFIREWKLFSGDCSVSKQFLKPHSMLRLRRKPQQSGGYDV